MSQPVFWSSRDARRIAAYTKRRERRRAKLGHAPPPLSALGGVRILRCTSQPNVEAIEDGGTWPQLVNAAVVREVDGYHLDRLQGRCEEPHAGDGGPGGGNCGDPVSPCDKTSRVRLVWSGASAFGYADGDVAAVLSYVSEGADYWRYETDDGAWVAILGVRQRGGSVVCSDDCYGDGNVTWRDAPAGMNGGYWFMTNPLTFLNDGVVSYQCQYLCSQGVHFSGSGVVGEAVTSLRLFWEGAAGSSAMESAEDPPGDDVEDDDGDLLCRIGRFCNGIPFFGEVFAAVPLGGLWYQIDCHHSGIVGNMTTRAAPRTLYMDRCGYEVPFEYYPMADPQATENTRHLVAWNAAKRKYLMVAMGNCQ